MACRVDADKGFLELLQQFALDVGEKDWGFNHNLADQVAGTAAAHGFDSLAAQAAPLAGLVFLRNPDLGRAIEGWHIDGGAECCLREADRHLAIQVVALALKDRVWANLHIDVQIAVRRTTRPCFALASETDAVTGIDTGRDLDLEHTLGFDPAIAMTVATGRFDRPAGALAMRAGLLNRKNTLLNEIGREHV